MNNENFDALFNQNTNMSNANADIQIDPSALQTEQKPKAMEKKALADPEKLQKMVAAYEETKNQYEEIANKIKKLTAKKKEISQNADKQEAAITDYLDQNKIDKISVNDYKLTVRDYRPKVVADIKQIPVAYTKQRITTVIDKTKIFNAIQSGITINGAHLENVRKTTIKNMKEAK